MDGTPKKWARRLFLKLSAFTIFQWFIGCSARSNAKEALSENEILDSLKHHPETQASSGGNMSFFIRRFKGAFSTIKIPKNHLIPEEKAIDQLNQLKKNDTITWLGHSTFLIRLNKKTILTDPFLTDWASPVSWAGPKRFVQPGISIPNLPKIDTIIITHNHYDHLDIETAKALSNKQEIDVLVPLGLKPFFMNIGYSRVQELNWEETTSLYGFKFTSLPAVHFSGRGLFDRNKTLWCSWAIEAGSNKIYFSGDTAYSAPIFKKIKSQFKAFDVAIVPIGAYEPQSMMKPVHTTPEEAVQLGIDINARTIISSHWGTIELSDEPHFEPPLRFKTHTKKMGFSNENTWNMKIGETKIIS